MKNKLTILLTLLLAGCSTVPRDEEPANAQTNHVAEVTNGKTNSFPVIVKPRR